SAWKHRHKDGRVIDVDIVAHDLSFGGRRAALVVANDVTSLKAAQASLAKSTQRLRVLHEIDRGMIAAAEPVAIAEAALRALRDSGVHVYMVVPMRARGELIGSLSFGGARGQFSDEQIEIAQEAAAQLAIAITQARLYEQVKRYSEELEQRVRERTHELAEAK